jgi:hypothetical protein
MGFPAKRGESRRWEYELEDNKCIDYTDGDGMGVPLTYGGPAKFIGVCK